MCYIEDSAFRFTMQFVSHQRYYTPVIRPLLQPALNRLPVNNIPNSTEVFRLSVLVLQIVCMLPSINTQQWCELSNDRVLVGICANSNLTSLIVLYQPSPTTALDTG